MDRKNYQKKREKDWQPPERMMRGRPKMTWTIEIEKAMSEIGTTDDNENGELEGVWRYKP